MLRSHRVTEARIRCSISKRKNGDEGAQFGFAAETSKNYFADAAGLPLNIRSWKELDGVTVRASGEQRGWSYYFFDGSEHFPIYANVWKFRRLRANEFRIRWWGKWEYTPGTFRIPFKLSTTAKFLGIEISRWRENTTDPTGARSLPEAQEWMARNLVSDDFHLDAEQSANREEDYFFPIRLDA